MAVVLVPVAALACMAAALVLLAVHGASDWSESFAAVWYGLLGGALVLGLVGLVGAVRNRMLSPRQRSVALSLSILPLLVVGSFALLIWYLLHSGALE
jgi:hypothetical protein